MLAENNKFPLLVPVSYSLAILRPGVRELRRRECRPNLIHSVWALPILSYRCCKGAGSQRAGGGAPVRVCVEGVAQSVSAFPPAFVFF